MPTLVYDAVTDPASGTFSSSIVFKGTRYISVTTPEYGTEIWTTDGTDAGTQLFKDIAPNSSASPIFYGATDDLLFFTASTGEYGREMWVTDGTVEGTRMVKDIRGGSSSSVTISARAFIGTTLYFIATDGSTGNDLWKTDGTAEGTVQVIDMINGANDYISAGLVAFNNHIFFYGSNGERSTIIKSDGTEFGTAAMDIGTVTLATSFTKVGPYLYTPATDGITGRELWRTDGTDLGTVLIKNITNIDDVNFYFTATEATTGTELWKSDGTEVGTVLVKDINSGTSNSSISSITRFGSYIYFSANDGTNGSELWRSDGTEVGTVMIKDIAAGAGGSSVTIIATTTDNLMYLSASDGTTGLELWKSDGTSEGTVLIKDINTGSASSSPQLLYVADDELYFSAITDGGREFWKTDGTTEGTVLIKDIIGNGDAFIYLQAISNSNDLVFYLATSSPSNINSELWKTDGTTEGTIFLKEINPGPTGSRVAARMIKINNTTFFAATNATIGTELWKSDGTPEGTVLVKDIRSGSGSSSPGNFAQLGSLLIFSASDGVNGDELWKSDGTEVGTVMIKDIRTGSSGSSPLALTAASSSIYFAANNGTNGQELWRTDGTAEGTYIVRDSDAGTNSGFQSIVNNYTINENVIIFIGSTNNSLSQLLRSDGTSGGTYVIKDFSPDYSDSILKMTTTDSGISFVLASNHPTGQSVDYRLWKTDGTVDGTVLVKDINGETGEYSESGAYGSLVAADTRIYFFVNTFLSTGFEIWTSDGTTDGTYMIKDINPGVASGVDISDATYLRTVGDVAFFQGMNEEYGAELWKTDGTEEGTYMLDIFPGPGSSAPSELLVTNNETELYLSAVSSGVGRELMRLPLTPTTTLSSVTTSSISQTGATVSTSITDVGFSPAHTRGFNYGTSLSYGMSTSTQGRYSLSTYEYTLSDLTCNTTYYVQAFAVNTYGTTTQTTSFTTSACDAVATPSSSRRGGGGSRISVPVAPTSTTPVIPSTPLPTLVVPPTSSSNTAIYTRDLSFGSVGTDVLTLQRFLNSRGFTVSTTGPGSPGNEINVFGSRTQAALARFQTSVGITPSGYFGPITRSFVNALGTPTQIAPAVPTAPTTPTTPQTTTPASKNTTTYTRDLFLGSRGSDVTQLQNFLIQQGYLESGFATGYFGQLTQSALIKFQQAKNIIPALGYFGPRTRVVIEGNR